MKKLSLGIASTFLFVTIAALAANFTDDQLQFGKPGSSANKEIVFGASNKKKLKHVPGTLTLDYEGNNLSVGDGLNTSDKTLKLNKGANSPTLRHNFTSGDLEIENAPVLNQKGNTISVGDGTNTNKVLKFNKGASSPEIRYNSSTGKLQFTNDTTTYKDIGSGSGGGGGVNLLQEFNSDFESGSPPQNWTASGGTFITETTNPLFGLQSGSWDSNASSQTLSSQLVTIEKGFIGKKCTADIEYQWPSGVSGDLSFQVVDQVPNILATVNLEPTSGSNTRKAFLAFDCPSVATDQLRVRLLSNVANPALIVVDNAFVGVNKSTTNVTQASVWARARWLPAINCQWDNAAGTAVLTFWSDFPADTDCNNPQVFGQAVVPGTKVPRLRVANLPPGKYRFEAKGLHGNVGSNTAVWTTTDGTNDGGDRINSVSASSVFQGPITGFFEYTSAQSNVEFRVVHQLTSGSGSGIIPNSETTQNENIYELVLYRYPTESAEALNLETSGYLVQAKIEGTNPSLSTVDVTSLSQIGVNGLTLTPFGNSQTARIPCAGAAATGATCAGDEIIGIEIDAPYAGDYEVCAQFTSAGAIGGAAGSQLEKAFAIVEQDVVTGTTITRAGVKRATQLHSYEGSTSSQFMWTPFTLCEVWPVASAGKRRFALDYTQDVVGAATISSNLILTDASGGAQGGRNVTWTVKSLTQQFPAPVFTEVTTLSRQAVRSVETDGKMVAGEVNRCGNGGANTFTAFNGAAAIQSVAGFSGSQSRITWVPGFWTQKVYCTISSRSGSGGPTTTPEIRVNVQSTTLMDYECEDPTQPVSFICVGK